MDGISFAYKWSQGLWWSVILWSGSQVRAGQGTGVGDTWRGLRTTVRVDGVFWRSNPNMKVLSLDSVQQLTLEILEFSPGHNLNLLSESIWERAINSPKPRTLTNHTRVSDIGGPERCCLTNGRCGGVWTSRLPTALRSQVPFSLVMLYKRAWRKTPTV